MNRASRATSATAASDLGRDVRLLRGEIDERDARSPLAVQQRRQRRPHAVLVREVERAPTANPSPSEHCATTSPHGSTMSDLPYVCRPRGCLPCCAGAST